MFAFFNKKKRHEEAIKKRIVSVLNDLDRLIDDASSSRMYVVVRNLQSVKDRIDNVSSSLTEKQLSEIELLIDSIKTHMNPSYSDFIVGKCNKITNILISGTIQPQSAAEKTIESNEEIIAEKKADKDLLIKQLEAENQIIAQIEEKMSNLGKEMNKAAASGDEIAYTKYYNDKESLKGDLRREKIKQQTLRSKIKGKEKSLYQIESQNATISNNDTLNEADEVSSIIESQNDLVDIADMQERANHISQTSQKANETLQASNALLDQAFDNSMDGDYDEDDATIAYQKAREAYLLQDKSNTDESSDTKPIDRN